MGIPTTLPARLWREQRILYFHSPTEPKTLLHIEDLLSIKNLILAANIEVKMERTKTSLVHRNQFLVEFREPANLLTVKTLVRDIGNLLSLLVGEAVQPLKIRLTLSPDSHSSHPYVDYFLGLRNRSIAKKSMFEMPLPFARSARTEPKPSSKTGSSTRKVSGPYTAYSSAPSTNLTNTFKVRFSRWCKP